MVSPLVTCTLILSSLYPCWLTPLASSSASGLVTPAWRGCSPAALWLDIHLAGGKWTCCKTDHYTKGGRGRIRGIDPATRNRRGAARAGSVHVFGSAVRSRIHEGDVRAQHSATGPVLTGQHSDLHLNGRIGRSPPGIQFSLHTVCVCITCIPHIGSSHR